MEKRQWDFAGYATRNDLRCSDGRIIRKDAFKECDGEIVPLVWNHQHDSISEVLGHALLENREDGMYAYGYFNKSPEGLAAKERVNNGDVKALSIYANRLKQNGNNVLHGAIREVSLVLAGANPGAFIETVLRHSDSADEMVEDGAIIYSGEDFELYHAEEGKAKEVEVKTEEGEKMPNDKKAEEKKDESKEKTIGEVFDTLTEDQKNVVYALIGQAIEDAQAGEFDDDEDEDEEGEEMKHNVFDMDNENTISHGLTDEETKAIFGDAKRYGSLKDSFLAHAEDYGITNIGELFPDYKNVDTVPGFISRDMTWVQKFMGSVHHTPFSRVRSMYANITEDAARAKGYFTGKQKKDEVFSLLKRTVDPQTIYKRQRLDRDDILDITDFDVVAWIKGEMRVMLNEEIARACLIGDGRLTSDDDKIFKEHVQPISTDADLYTIKAPVTVGADDDETATNFIRAAIKARKTYKGTGSPMLFTTEEMLTNMLLLTDKMGRDLYDSVDKLATKLRVSEIVTVEVMEGQKGKNGGDLLGIIVNPVDYTIGADKGGAVSMFDDFDIDYNQQKYLIETRCSGALVRPYSAIALETATTTTPTTGEDDGE